MVVKTIAAESPDRVALTTLPDGTVMAALRDNVTEVAEEDCTGYAYDEVIFPLPQDRAAAESAASVEAAFDDWWAYGAAYTKEEAAPTLEERVACIENAFAELMDM